MALPARRRAAIYARISETDEAFDKVASQVLRLREEADKHGYEVLDVFADDGISAYAVTERPGFSALSRAIGEGRFDVVMATEPSRFARQAEVSAVFLGLCARMEVSTHTLTDGVSDLSDPTVKAMAGFAYIFADMESGIKAGRVRARNAADFRSGKPRAGKRAFGYEDGNLVAKPSEAAMIREAYTAILEQGASQQAIAKRWNLAGVTTTHGKAWTSQSVRDVLLRPMNAGMLRRAVNWRRGIKRSEVEYETSDDSSIEALVDRETYERFVALVEHRPAPRGRPATALLSGIMRCPCGEPMFGSSDGEGVATYRCQSRQRPGTRPAGTKHATIVRHRADEQAVEGLYFALLDVDLDRSAPSVAPIQARLSDLYEQRAEQSSHLTIRGVDPKPIRRVLASIADMIEEAEADLQRAMADDVTAPLRAALALVDIDEADLDDGSTVSYVDSSTRAAHFAEEFRRLPIETQRAVFRGAVDVRLTKRRKPEHAVQGGRIDFTGKKTPREPVPFPVVRVQVSARAT